MRHALALIAGRLALLLVLLLTACADPALRVPDPPRIVRVPVTEYVPVPEALTARMDPGTPQAQDYAEAKRLALVRLQIIRAGNCRFLRIAALGRALGPAEQAEWAANACDGVLPPPPVPLQAAPRPP